MKKPFLSFAGLLLAAIPALAQTPAQLKQELRQKETAAGKNADKLLEAGKWAESKGMISEAKRIYQAILKLEPGHKGANEALGNEEFEGKWLTAKDAAAARRKAKEAEYKAAGMVEVGGVYVGKDEIDDAKRGIYHHDGQVVSKDEKIAFMNGMVRHPDTGEIIEPKFLDNAQKKLFPIGTEGRWVPEKEADDYHSDPGRPWLLRSQYCTLASTLPLAKLQEIKALADRGVERVQPLFGGQPTLPSLRPTIVIAATRNEYVEYGTSLGDATSAYGAFLASDRASLNVPYQGEVRPAVCHWETEKQFGPFYLRHAAGMSYANSLAVAAGAELPLWFVEGCGSYASRFENDHYAGWFGKQHLAKGGVKDLKAWFNSYTINGDLESTEMDYNIYQAGLMLSFAANGGDDKAVKAMQDVTAAMAEGKAKAIEKSIDALRSVLIDREEAIRAHLQVLISRFRG